MILGLCGFADCGKDTAAAYLVKEFNFIQVSFADKLKELVYNINPYIPHDLEGVSHHLKDIVDKEGWENAKRNIIEVREFLQQTGQGTRVTFGSNFWITQALTPKILNNKDIVISDVRYENEVKHISDIGGKIIRITREGYGPLNDHISEKELPCDYVIHNVQDSRIVLYSKLRELVFGMRRLENY